MSDDKNTKVNNSSRCSAICASLAILVYAAVLLINNPVIDYFFMHRLLLEGGTAAIVLGVLGYLIGRITDG